MARSYFKSQVIQTGRCCGGVCVKRLYVASAADTAAATTMRLRLRLDFDLSLHRVSDETLLVRGMIHLLNVLGRWLILSGEF